MQFAEVLYAKADTGPKCFLIIYVWERFGYLCSKL